MQISKNAVVSISYELSDSQGKILDKSVGPISYLHGGYDGIFPTVEEALHGKSQGEDVAVTLQPDDAFGEYDAELIRVEPRDLFPENVEIGMQFEGGAEGSQEEFIYTVTDVAEDKVVVDGNHPLAGQTLRFQCHIEGVRPATDEEVAHGHVHGAHGHHH
jgi:FKBP-type peptidyl-prolyl cis-trans isomerase SlyD